MHLESHNLSGKESAQFKMQRAGSKPELKDNNYTIDGILLNWAIGYKTFHPSVRSYEEARLES